MLPIQSFNTLMEWERRLEIEDQKRKEHRSEMHASYPTLTLSTQNESLRFTSKDSKGKVEQKNVYQGSRQEVCCETQPG